MECSGRREGAVSPYRLAPARRDCELSRTRPPCPPSRTSRPTPPPSPSRLFPALPARPGGKRDEYDREVPKKICPDVPPLSLRGLSSGRFPRGNPEPRKVGVAGGVAGGVAASLGCGVVGGVTFCRPPGPEPRKVGGEARYLHCKHFKLAGWKNSPGAATPPEKRWQRCNSAPLNSAPI